MADPTRVDASAHVHALRVALRHREPEAVRWAGAWRRSTLPPAARASLDPCRHATLSTCDLEHLIHEIEAHIRSGALHVAATPRTRLRLPELPQPPELLAPEVETVDANDAAPVREQLAWVEVRLLDEEGKPIPGNACRITLADGQVHALRTDAQGLIRIAGLAHPDPCEVLFPEAG